MKENVYKIFQNRIFATKKKLMLRSHVHLMRIELECANRIYFPTPNNAASDQKSTCVPRYQRVIRSLLPTGTGGRTTISFFFLILIKFFQVTKCFLRKSCMVPPNPICPHIYCIIVNVNCSFCRWLNYGNKQQTCYFPLSLHRMKQLSPMLQQHLSLYPLLLKC